MGASLAGSKSMLKLHVAVCCCHLDGQPRALLPQLHAGLYTPPAPLTTALQVVPYSNAITNHRTCLLLPCRLCRTPAC